MISVNPFNAFKCIKNGLVELRASFIERRLPDWTIAGLTWPRYFRKKFSKACANQLSYLNRALPLLPISRNDRDKSVKAYVKSMTDDYDPWKWKAVNPQSRIFFNEISQAAEEMIHPDIPRLPKHVHYLDVNPIVPSDSSNAEFTCKKGGNLRSFLQTHKIMGKGLFGNLNDSFIPLPLLRKQNLRIREKVHSLRYCLWAPFRLIPPELPPIPAGLTPQEKKEKKALLDADSELQRFYSSLPYKEALQPVPQMTNFYLGNLFGSKIARSSKDLSKGKQPEPSTPVMLSEYGWKHRWVTKSPYKVVECNGYMQRVLWPRLSRLPECRLTLKKPIEECKFFMGFYRADAKIYSVDFSTATDTISLHVLRHAAMKLGVLYNWNMMPFHQYLSDGTTSKPMTRGSLMGLGLSWTLLSLVHAAICRCVNGPKRRFASHLKGDDNISYWSKTQWQLYLKLSDWVGLKVNLKKTFISDKFAVFGEVTLVVIREGPKVFLVPESRFYSLRFLTKANASFRRPECRNEPESFVLTIGKNLLRLPQRQRWDCFKTVYPEVLWFMRKHPDWNPFLPLQLGGLGLPPPKSMPSLAPRWARVIATRWHNSHKFPNSLLYITAKGELDSYVAKYINVLEDKLEWFYPGSTTNDLASKDQYEKIVTEVITEARLFGMANMKEMESLFTKTRFISWYNICSKLRLKQAILKSSSTGFSLAWTYDDLRDYTTKLLPSTESLSRAWVGKEPDTWESWEPLSEGWVMVKYPRPSSKRRRGRDHRAHSGFKSWFDLYDSTHPRDKRPWILS
jgi:hypothetical protein